ncbi:YSIRK-type signal peptide-containing protein [Staphylococcus delphini]|uniref:YSIRK-type signal peptide-containing protein n=1 Tax=Staphylococcus delphini TaxID=53344 RepID=UPI001F5B9BF7|nr:YSIRK-type signal peptide-containing protein [Staphylococcus delphini]
MQEFNKHNTFALRKLSMGVSSIMIASGLFIVAGQGGQAAENAQIGDVQPQESNDALNTNDSASLKRQLKNQPVTSGDSDTTTSKTTNNDQTASQISPPTELEKNPTESSPNVSQSKSQSEVDPEYSVVDRQGKDKATAENSKKTEDAKQKPQTKSQTRIKRSLRQSQKRQHRLQYKRHLKDRRKRKLHRRLLIKSNLSLKATI